jgi:hypothetical protein
MPSQNQAVPGHTPVTYATTPCHGRQRLPAPPSASQLSLRMKMNPNPTRLLGNRASRQPRFPTLASAIRCPVVRRLSPTLHCRQVLAIMYSRPAYDKQMSNKQTL